MKSIKLSQNTIISFCETHDCEIIVKDRIWRFDFDRNLGPIWLKADGSDRKCQNPNKTVWNEFNKWLKFK